MLGLAVAGLILLVAHFSGIAQQVGWVPFIFLAIIGFGFATWEAGFIGMQARTFISLDSKKHWIRVVTFCL